MKKSFIRITLFAMLIAAITNIYGQENAPENDLGFCFVIEYQFFKPEQEGGEKQNISIQIKTEDKWI